MSDDGDLDPSWAADEAFRDGYEHGAAVAFGLMGMGEAIRWRVQRQHHYRALLGWPWPPGADGGDTLTNKAFEPIVYTPPREPSTPYRDCARCPTCGGPR